MVMNLCVIYKSWFLKMYFSYIRLLVLLEWKPLGHSQAVRMVFTSALYILKIFVKCYTYVSYEQCIDKA